MLPRSLAPASAGVGGDIRASISYCVALLAALGVGGLSAEALRQAKFDAAAPAERLWRALHDVVALALAGFPRAGAPATALEAAWRAGAPRGGVPAEGAHSRRSVALFALRAHAALTHALLQRRCS
jgi:plasmid stabilization system protein ParE